MTKTVNLRTVVTWIYNVLVTLRKMKQQKDALTGDARRAAKLLAFVRPFI